MKNGKQLLIIFAIALSVALCSCVQGAASDSPSEQAGQEKAEVELPDYPGRHYLKVENVYFNVSEGWELDPDVVIDWEVGYEYGFSTPREFNGRASVTVGNDEKEMEGDYHIKTVDGVVVYMFSYDIGGSVSFNYKGNFYSYHFIGIMGEDAVSETEHVASTLVFG